MSSTPEVGFDKIMGLFSLERALLDLTPEDEFTLFQDFVSSLMSPNEAKKIRIIWSDVRIELLKFFLKRYNGTLVPTRKRKEAFYLWIIREYRRDYPELWAMFDNRLENGS